MAREMFLCPLLVLAACGSGDSECTDIAPGDAILLVSEANSTIRDVVENEPVPLIRPIQGGQILLIGVRVRSSETCSYIADGSIYDGTTDALLGRDIRRLELLPGSDGFARPEPGFVPLINVAVCPASTASGRIDGSPQRLQVDLRDEDENLVATLSKVVVPTCPSGNTGCTADCM